MTKNSEDPEVKSNHLDKGALRKQYDAQRPLYVRLTKQIKDAIESFLIESNIPYIDIFSRIKDFDSAAGKIDRKKYSKPFEEIEDWCGLRIICYYPSDVERICAVLQKEFDIREEEDTALRLKPHEFGYRSTHLIVKIKESWLGAPPYRGLGEFKAEIQVRTLLMHAWAEIEHKLAYKSTEQVPDPFKRKLYRLSAKFEEADEQFEELRLGLTKYRESLLVSAATNTLTLADQELNLDTIQAFLDTIFTERERDESQTATFLEEISKINLSMAQIVAAYERVKPVLHKIEENEVKNGFGEQTLPLWNQVGAMRTVLDTADETYYGNRLKFMGNHNLWYEWVTDSRKILSEFEKNSTKKPK